MKVSDCNYLASEFLAMTFDLSIVSQSFVESSAVKYSVIC